MEEKKLFPIFYQIVTKLNNDTFSIKVIFDQLFSGDLK